VKLWDVASGREIQTVANRWGTLRHLCFSPDGKLFLAAGDSLTLWAMNGPSASELCAFHVFEDGAWAVAAPDGRYDSSSSGDVLHLHFAIGTTSYPLERFRKDYYRPGLLAELAEKPR
jgi:WD40 repeat protein